MAPMGRHARRCSRVVTKGLPDEEIEAKSTTSRESRRTVANSHPRYLSGSYLFDRAAASENPGIYVRFRPAAGPTGRHPNSRSSKITNPPPGDRSDGTTTLPDHCWMRGIVPSAALVLRHRPRRRSLHKTRSNPPFRVVLKRILVPPGHQSAVALSDGSNVNGAALPRTRSAIQMSRNPVLALTKDAASTASRSPAFFLA